MRRYSHRIPTALHTSLVVYPDDNVDCAASGIILTGPSRIEQLLIKRRLVEHDHMGLMGHLLRIKYFTHIPWIGSSIIRILLENDRKKTALRWARQGYFCVDYDSWRLAIKSGSCDELDVLYESGTFPRNPVAEYNTSLANGFEEVAMWLYGHYAEVRSQVHPCG